MLDDSTWLALRRFSAFVYVTLTALLDSFMGFSLTGGSKRARRRWQECDLGAGCVHRQRILFTTRPKSQELAPFKSSDVVTVYAGHDDEGYLLGDDVTLMAVDGERAVFAYTPGIDVYSSDVHPFVYA